MISSNSHGHTYLQDAADQASSHTVFVLRLENIILFHHQSIKLSDQSLLDHSKPELTIY